MLLACYSHKHISYRIRTIIRKAIRCMVPESDGILSSSFKESLWDRYYMGAPKQHRRFVEQYKIEKRA
ncbi:MULTISPECIES: hypothetical protein [unclassified Wolbachia]|uniref:hypothetical protein n=1 Tax=unclassified Wolbachia TaxID=2640676 RepID=UPI0031330EEA